jgi:hypothetical protein
LREERAAAGAADGLEDVGGVVKAADGAEEVGEVGHD